MSNGDRVVEVQVERLLGAGAAVKLPDGRPGFVRVREMGWGAASRRHWRERYPVGQHFDALILAEDPAVELSFRLAQSDPWTDVLDRYPPGSLAEGVVTGITDYGAFVELETGITGLLHKSCLPPNTQASPDAMFWPGDLVKVVISEVDGARRRLSLDLAALRPLRWERVGEVRAAPAVERRRGIDRSGGQQLALEALLRTGGRAVLVVEGDVRERQALAAWLRHAGQDVLSAESAAEALDVVRDSHPHFALVDARLPDGAGVQTVRQIVEAWPDTRCGLMADWSTVEAEAAALEELSQRGVTLLVKPLLPEDVLEVFTAGQPAAARGSSLETLPSLTFDLGGTSPRQLNLLLSQLRAKTGAASVVLFQLVAASRKIQVVDQVGPDVLVASPELIHSPVRDVAEDRLVVVAPNAQALADARFRHLALPRPFAACLGIPVPLALVDSYALFLFFDRPNSVTDVLRAHAEASATRIAAWLERRDLVTKLGEIQRLALLGHLARSLIHEVNHQLNPVAFAIEELQLECEQMKALACAGEASQVERRLSAGQVLLRDLNRAASRLINTTRQYRRITQSDRTQLLFAEELVQEVIGMVADEALQARVTVDVAPLPKFAFVRGQAASIQQALSNLLLNAIQQIAETHGPQGGRVLVSVARAVQDNRPIVSITVEDDGPGIHRRLWERIFDLGFTTRDSGSGLGLPISLSLIKSQGGRMYVAESYIGWGTKMVIEVPSRT